MEKLYYSIGEVAGILGEKDSLVRYWSNEFDSFFDLTRNAKGNRKYTSDDIQTLKQIHFLVKTKGMTLDGARKALKEERSSIDRRVRALESLRAIRQQLDEVRKGL